MATTMGALLGLGGGSGARPARPSMASMRCRISASCDRGARRSRRAAWKRRRMRPGSRRDSRRPRIHHSARRRACRWGFCPRAVARGSVREPRWKPRGARHHRRTNCASLIALRGCRSTWSAYPTEQSSCSAFGEEAPFAERPSRSPLSTSTKADRASRSTSERLFVEREALSEDRAELFVERQALSVERAAFSVEREAVRVGGEAGWAEREAVCVHRELLHVDREASTMSGRLRIDRANELEATVLIIIPYVPC